MDKELRKLDEAIEYEKLHLEYRKKLVLFGENRIVALEGEKIERLAYLIQERIAVRKKGITRTVIQKRFGRKNLQEINSKKFSTLFISANGYLKYHIHESDTHFLKNFDFNDEKLINSINRKNAINALEGIYKSIS